MSLCGVILPHQIVRYNHNPAANFHKLFLSPPRKEVHVVYMSQVNVFFKRTIVVLLWLAGLYIFFRWLLLALLPFLIALALAATVEPLVQRLRRRLRVRRSFAAAVITTLLLLTLGGGAALLLIRLAAELQAWSNRLPEAMAQFPQLWNSLLDRVDSWYVSCPVFLRSALDGMAQQLMTEGPSLAGAVSGWLMEAASSVLSAPPAAGLFVVTTLLAVYFTSLSYPAILSFLKRQLPESWQKRCRSAAQCCRSTILKWMRAELLLILITFLLLLGGFTWMGLDFALLAAAFTALVDALPVLGVGAVLIPWAILSLLLGNTGQALALLALYAVTSLTHSLVEPRLLAGQADLPPITALLAMYLGFHFMGVGGMILFPVFLPLVKQLQDAGVIHLWK